MPPGQEGKIELAIEHTESYAGEVAKSASVSTNDSKNPNFNLTLRARFKSNSPVVPPTPGPLNPNPVLTVEPIDRLITSVLTGSSSSNTFFIHNPHPTPVLIKDLIPGGNSFTVKLTTIEEGKRYQLNITSNPALKAGKYIQTVRLVTDSTTQPEVKIELSLEVFPKVLASPASIIMPELPITSDLTRVAWPSVFVRKLRGDSFQIKSYTSTLTFLKLELSTEAEGQAYKLKLSIDSTKVKPGEFKGTINIKTNDPDIPDVVVPVQGSFK